MLLSASLRILKVDILGEAVEGVFLSSAHIDPFWSFNINGQLDIKKPLEIFEYNVVGLFSHYIFATINTLERN